MSRFLLTGATTPVGRSLVRALLEREGTERVMAVGIEPSFGSRPEDARFDYVSVDLTRFRQLRRLMFGPVVDAGVNTIVDMASHRSAIAKGERVNRLNVEATRELLQICEQHPTIRRYVFKSEAEVYKVRPDRPTMLTEQDPLEFDPAAPQRVRDRVEADLSVCARIGLTGLKVAVARCAECVGPDLGSQLYDYLRSRVCFRPMGFDPMVNLSTVKDTVRGLLAVATTDETGAFNLPGADTLPLSRVIGLWGRKEFVVPGPLLHPLYRLRSMTLGTEFRYDLNRWRFHFSGVLDGERARRVLGFSPENPIDWPTSRGWSREGELR
ncbi:MAG: NAD-dependent epimerase/dehydratase family protein [Myxococcales bacterium]|nr:NAD-dependent epimerase/dehydratase family protein [Myxococcales bacterium]